MDLTTLKQAVLGLADSVTQAAKRKPQEAVEADATLALAGKNATQWGTVLDQPLTDHLGEVLPHITIPSQAGTYSRNELETQLARLIRSAILPVSRYGSLGFLPVGVARDYEGATTVTDVRDSASIIEDDGTWVYLRNGTNGSSRGVYYSFLRNAYETPWKQPTKTNKRYQPAYFPAGYTAAYIGNCSDSVLFGRLQDASGNLSTTHFVSLTNGTFDETKHQGAFIELQNLPANRGEWVLIGNTVYAFYNKPITKLSDAVEVEVYTVPKATILAGGTFTLTKVTGITTDGFNGSIVADSIRLANVVYSTSLADKPCVLGSVAGSVPVLGFNFWHAEQPTLISAADSNGVIRTRIIGGTYVTTTNTTASAYNTFSWTYNPTTKRAVLDAKFKSQHRLTVDTAGTIGISGPIWDTPEAYDGYVSWWHAVTTLAFHPRGMIINHRVMQQADLEWHARSYYSNYTSKFAALLPGSLTRKSSERLANEPAYGSAIGGVLCGPFALSDTRMLISANGVDSKGAYIQERFMLTQLEGTPTYTYRSLKNGSYQGYKPSLVRQVLDTDLGRSTFDYTGALVEVSGSNLWASTLRYSKGLKNLGYRSVAADLTRTGQFTVADSVMQSVIDQVLNLTGRRAEATSVTCDLVYPQHGMRPFAVVSIYSQSARTYYVTAAILTVTATTTAITSATVVSLFEQAPAVTSDTALALTATEANLRRGGAVTVFETANSFLIGLTLSGLFQVIGNNPSVSCSFRVRKSDWGVVAAYGHLNVRSWNHGFHGQYYFATPSLGFGLCWGDADQTDYQTKMLFEPITKSDDSVFDAWTTGKSARLVLTSQDVASGFVVYFTESTPVLIGGKVYTLPTTTINLSNVKANPANTTFYAYVVLANGVVSYQITTTPMAESHTVMYIGSIVTNSTNVATLSITHTTRIDLYRISPSAKGSAIPVSDGTPDVSSTLNWT